MDVIRHHAPSKQFVGLVVLEQQRIFRQLRDARITQMAIANPMIQILLQFRTFLAVVFNLQQMLPFVASRGGHGINKPERNELNESRKITVRQVTAFVPAKKTKRLLLIG